MNISYAVDPQGLNACHDNMNIGCAYPGRTSSWALDVGLRRALQVERNEWMQYANANRTVQHGSDST